RTCRVARDQATRTTHHPGRAPCRASDLSLAPRCRSRRPDELRNKACGCASPGRRLYRADPQGREASGSTGRAANQVRVRHQHANSENDRPHGADNAARPRRGRNRMRRRATSSLPGLTRQSILLRKQMDARVKPAHDGAKILCRREFILALGGATAPSLFWPLAARAQQMPVMGYLGALSPSWDEQRLSALRQSLAEAGYVEGKTVAIEYHWVEGDYDRLAGHAAEFVRRRVAVTVARSLPSALAAQSP